ncbi:MAG: hypothetical protein ACOYBL_08775 [Lachnospiraceae bacterium]|jgi:hypothetical protein
MKEYEAVREIFNLCSGNQMRDVFIEEIETDDLDAFVESVYKDEKEFSYEKLIHADGSVVYDIMTAGIKQRYTFTQI